MPEFVGAEVPSTNGLGNPTPTENLRSDSYTDSKTKCDTLPKTPDESGNYNHSVRVTYRLGISMKYARNRRARFPRPMDWETQPPTERIARAVEIPYGKS